VSGNFISLAYQADGLHIAYKRSIDGGSSWFPDTILAQGWNNGFFGDSHAQPSIFVDGSYAYLVWKFYHWGRYEWQHVTSVYCGITHDEGYSWQPFDTLTTILGTYNQFNSPSVYASAQNVHTVWQVPPYTYEEISYRESRDRGSVWQPEIRLTNDSARSISPFIAVQGTKIHVIWVDNRVGNYEIYYKRNLTGNGVGDKELRSSISSFPFTVRPNPFFSFASVPGHSPERFALYDVSGRKVGVYKGDRIGLGLSAGVYFLKPQGQDSKPLRIVKLR
jgi:hypothetical protein